MSDCILGVCFRSWCLWNSVNCVLTGIFLRCYIRIRSRSIDSILSLSRFGVYLSLSCVFLFACQVRIFLNRIFLSVRCLSDRVFSISFSCWRLWNIIDGFGAFVLLSCHIRVTCCGIDSILSLCSFCVYFRLRCILLFTSQVRVFLNRILLSVRCLSHRVFSVSLSCRRLRHIIDSFGAFILLSRYIRIGCCRIDGVFCFLSFGIHFRFGCILLFASQVWIFLNRVLLSVSCLSDCILSVCLSCRGLRHRVNGLRAFVLLSRYIRIACRGIDGILSLSRLGVYLSLSCVFLFASQVRIIFDGVLLSIGCLSDCILGISFSLRCLWHRVDCLRTFVLLSRHVIVACCGIDGILSLSRFGVYLSFGCILLFAS